MRQWKDVPIVSVSLVIVNVIVFIICTFTGDLLYNMGELGVQHVFFRGEYWRIISALFLHGGTQHIFNNMLILFLLGTMMEKEAGHVKYLMFYLLSGIGGNLIAVSYRLLTFDPTLSIGASTAIFGLDGVLLALTFFSKRNLPNVTPTRVFLMVAYSLYSGFTSPNVDNAAHVGGLIVGFLLGIIMCIIDNRRINTKGSERWSIEY